MAVEDIAITDRPGGGCACGGHDDATPVLDVRQVPHAIRHATVFGALTAIAPGFSLDLLAPHDPLPLLAQVEERQPGAFAVTYLVEGPEAWTVRLTRRLP
ncbi:Uncharacterized conserved protein, DUF2249 family [Georgenia satyanarayanai]|uniref:Uncharacterized conserved protein, DUF2249 family n=1 Tax=Georgenia satyanarayanai TaxID=860221 RepID=A0A2Y9AKJ0_9MICO|nr:DUF2249 domain-containing protein [Georgenia satyanarayanai]PYF98399.1 uncharacterized protein (DUF2249 family) [Georgenia satyanarayanai]SSA45034.1 Uncharacterized conserved protein, DUF2249 family [Georgenia satyanarayanai]